MADVLMSARARELLDAIELHGPAEEDYALAYALYWLKARRSAPSTTFYAYRQLTQERRTEIQRAVRREAKNHDWVHRQPGKAPNVKVIESMLAGAAVHVAGLSDAEKWMLLTGSLLGTMDYSGVAQWLIRFASLDAALLAALRHRGGTALR